MSQSATAAKRGNHDANLAHSRLPRALRCRVYRLGAAAVADRDGAARVLGVVMGKWQPIETAPTDGTRILGRRFASVDRYTGALRYHTRKTFWGKTSHVSLYGWNWGRDVEDQNLWQPEHWKPIP